MEQTSETLKTLAMHPVLDFFQQCQIKAAKYRLALVWGNSDNAELLEDEIKNILQSANQLLRISQLNRDQALIFVGFAVGLRGFLESRNYWKEAEFLFTEAINFAIQWEWKSEAGKLHQAFKHWTKRFAQKTSP